MLCILISDVWFLLDLMSHVSAVLKGWPRITITHSNCNIHMQAQSAYASLKDVHAGYVTRRLSSPTVWRSQNDIKHNVPAYYNRCSLFYFCFNYRNKKYCTVLLLRIMNIIKTVYQNKLSFSIFVSFNWTICHFSHSHFSRSRYSLFLKQPLFIKFFFKSS